MFNPFAAFQTLRMSLLRACLTLLLAALLTSTASAQSYNPGGIGLSPGNPSQYTPRYNLEWGPIDYSLNAGITGSYNSNINLSEFHPETDFVLSPIVGVDARWDISDENILTFGGGIGYQIYMNHPEDDSYVITPNTKVSYNFLVGDNFHFNAHEAFSLTQNPDLVPQVSNVANFPVAINDAGLSMNYTGYDVLTPGVDYDHINQWVLSNQFKYLDYTEDSISPRVSYVLTPTMTVGVQSLFGYVQYDQTTQNNYFTINAGPYISGNLTNALSISAGVGGVYSVYDQQSSTEGNASNTNSSYYVNAGASYKIDDYWSVSAVAGHDYLQGLTSNYTERYYANFSATWIATDKLNVVAHVLGEQLQDSPGQDSEESTHYEGGVYANYTLNDHISLQGGYIYTEKDANIIGQSYNQHLITAGLNYSF